MNKYHNVRVVVDGISFASKKEAARYKELQLMEKAGMIWDLRLQPRYPLVVFGTRVGTYVGDFLYSGAKGAILEDVKGIKTPVYRIKKKLVLALYGIEIMEV